VPKAGKRECASVTKRMVGMRTGGKNGGVGTPHKSPRLLDG